MSNIQELWGKKPNEVAMTMPTVNLTGDFWDAYTSEIQRAVAMSMRATVAEGKLEDLRKEADRLRGVGDQALKRADEWAARFNWLRKHCGVVYDDVGNVIGRPSTSDNYHEIVDNHIRYSDGKGQPTVSAGVGMAAGPDSTVHAQVQSGKVLETFTELPNLPVSWVGETEELRPMTAINYNVLANSINTLARMIGRLQKG